MKWGTRPALSMREQAEVDAHVAECPECLRRLGEAERDGARVGTRQRCGVVAGGCGSGGVILGFVVPHAARRSNIATLAMIHSHFSHAQFSGTGPAAKALYARDRSWYYVIVTGSSRYEVYGIRSGRTTDLGITQPQGATSELFARVASRFDQIQLRVAGRTMESAAIR